MIIYKYMIYVDVCIYQFGTKYTLCLSSLTLQNAINKHNLVEYLLYLAAEKWEETVRLTEMNGSRF